MILIVEKKEEEGSEWFGFETWDKANEERVNGGWKGGCWRGGMGDGLGMG